MLKLIRKLVKHASTLNKLTLAGMYLH